MKNNFLSLFVIVILGLTLRLSFAFNSDFRIDSDEAIVGIMASDILAGYEIPIFYYGQNYMGNFEALSIAAFSYFFGESIYALKLVPIIYSIFLIIVVYLIGKNFNHKIGLLSALFTALAPSMLIVWSTKARGGFIEIVLISALSLLATIKYFQDPKLSRVAYIFLLLGFGWWVNNQIIFYLVPIGLFLLYFGIRNLKFKEIIFSLLISLFSFIIASLPFWYYNILNNFSSIKHFANSSKNNFSEYFNGLITQAVPILLGARQQWSTVDLLPGLGQVFMAFIALLLIFLVIKRLKYSSDFFRANFNQPYSLCFGILFFSFTVFTCSSFGFLYQAPRYLLPVYVVFNILLAATIYYLPNKLLRISITSSILFINIISNYPGAPYVPGEPIIFKQDRVSSDHLELIRWLELNDYNWVRTNYWVGYRLAFETNQKIKFLVFGLPSEHRIKSYDILGRDLESENMPLILSPNEAKLVSLALKSMGINYSVENIAEYVIFHKFKNFTLNENSLQRYKVTYDQLQISASSRLEDLKYIFDLDLTSRWGTGQPQNPKQYLEVTFNQAVPLRAINLNESLWSHDYPRQLEAYLEDSNGNQLLLCDENTSAARMYYNSYLGQNIFHFPVFNTKKIVLKQKGRHPVVDWSIAELELYQ